MVRGAFAGLELGRDAIPDETTILNFRHLLERHDLTKVVFTAVAEHLEARGALLRGGTIVDATLIAASPSTKNEAGRRDPEMRSSKKGNQWYFGMKAHIGVDACQIAPNSDPLLECAPDGGQFQAAVLTGCRAWRSSYCTGLR